MLGRLKASPQFLPVVYYLLQQQSENSDEYTLWKKDPVILTLSEQISAVMGTTDLRVGMEKLSLIKKTMLIQRKSLAATS